MIVSILIFFLTLSALIFVHEFAHFFVAKKSGVEVEEFGFGLPPRLWGKKIKGTIYSINLLPVGGFVRLKGEMSEVMGFGTQGSFSGASKKRRSLIIIAGVLGNVLLAYFIFLFLFLVGNPRFSGQVFIEAVNSASPAEASGISPGDLVRRVDNQEVENISVLIAYIESHRGQEVELALSRGDQEVRVKTTPRVSPPENEGPLGVKLNVRGDVVYDQVPFWQAPYKALQEVIRSVYMVLFGFFSMIKTLLSFNVPQGVTGIVGIYKLSSEAAGIGWRVFLQFVAILSVNLFVFNSLPLPALDGGRLLFVFLEKLFKRKIPASFENNVNNFGLAFLLLIFVLITIHDVRRFWG